VTNSLQQCRHFLKLLEEESIQTHCAAEMINQSPLWMFPTAMPINLAATLPIKAVMSFRLDTTIIDVPSLNDLAT
jgi:formate hydrogenlyase subunit 4